jgi:hypothetical protein
MTNWYDIKGFTRADIEARYNKLTDDQWNAIVSYIAESDDEDDNGNELPLDEFLHILISDIDKYTNDYLRWKS